MIDRGRDTSSSLVIISKKTLIGGVLAISLFSFGLGYFFGYGGTTSDKVVKRVEADSKVAPSEERTVLDSSGKPTLAPPAMPGLVPKEQPKAERQEAPNTAQQQRPATAQPQQQLQPQKQPQQQAAKPSPQIPFPQMAEQKPSQPAQRSNVQQQEAPKLPATQQKNDLQKSNADNSKSADQGVRKRGLLAKNDTDENAAAPAPKNKAVKKEKARKKKSAKSAKAGKSVKKTTAADKKAEDAYFIQAGAFADRGKAEKLKGELNQKGFKPTMTTFSPSSGKTLFRVRLGPYTTKKDADDHASGLKDKGFGSIVVPGQK